MKGVSGISIVKLVVGGITGYGVSAIVSHAVRRVVPQNIGKFQKVSIWVGEQFAGAFAGAIVGAYAEQQVDVVANVFKAVMHPEETKEEGK